MLEARNLTVSIAGQPICQNLNLTVRPGELWAILGRNGSGKTTLLHTLAGLRAPDAGQVLVNDRPISNWPKRALARQLGILLQDSEDMFPSTVLESALAGRHPHLGRWNDETPHDLVLTRQALAETDLADRENISTHVLSGGERRRLALATLFSQSPRILLLDEPVNHLDLAHQVRALESVTRRVQDGFSLAMAVLHDVNLAARFCNRVLMLHGDGHGNGNSKVDIGLTNALLTGQKLSELYQHPVRAINHEGGRFFVLG